MKKVKPVFTPTGKPITIGRSFPMWALLIPLIGVVIIALSFILPKPKEQTIYRP